MIHVLIERFIAEGMISNYEKQALTVLQQTYAVPGFISGEAFSDLNNDHHRLVLCKWRSSVHWERWHASRERKDLVGTLTPILDRPERITLLSN